MSDFTIEVGSSVAIQKNDLDKLLNTLRKLGYQTIGPRIENDAITYAPISGLADLPRGYTSDQDGGKYRLMYSGHPRYFDVTPGAPSWKQFFYPPRSTLLTFSRNGKGWDFHPNQEIAPSLALIGVRPCELSAILIQDRVFLREEWSDPIYRSRRQAAFILAVNCLHPGGTCFCASMGTGPRAETGYDLCLTELEDVFLVQIGSEAGRMALAGLPVQPASAYLLQAANKGLEDARKRMGRVLPEQETLSDYLLENLEHPHWDVVAKRCLSCGNCTQVCPTCFCWDATDQPDLSGNATTRVRTWDSCFNPDYSYIAGGNSRPNARSRYRQWLTHKLASWSRQFDISGCVGCGRCITWCPAGIDLTEEVAALRKESIS
ncbi:MAG: 4Fe-4S dicluster domain-containing protein [Chloroflexi bacterium]|nr:4Fe-4S dicluster domain-containing protein [Chloroflexota bacterium]